MLNRSRPTVADIRATLDAFHRHLLPDGLLVLEMRNAAHFLTPEGQHLLRHERADDVALERGHLRYTIRLEIDPATQLLDRYYTWQPPGGPPVVEHLRHRLLFPQELAAHLESRAPLVKGGPRGKSGSPDPMPGCFSRSRSIALSIAIWRKYSLRCSRTFLAACRRACAPLRTGFTFVALRFARPVWLRSRCSFSLKRYITNFVPITATPSAPVASQSSSSTSLGVIIAPSRTLPFTSSLASN
jgi:hypothetical protein